MSVKKLVVIFTSLLTLAACESPIEQSQASAVEQVEYFTDTGLSNPVALIQHPAGEHVNGITYVTYQGPLEDPYVAAYNHNTLQWLGPVKAGVSDMGKDPNRKIDNHGKPAMIIDDLGYIHIAFGGHGGVRALGENTLGNYNYGRLQHVVSKRPYDISEWETLNNVSPFGTYNQWVKMANGDLYLIYRHGAHRSNWVYQKSTDHGRTFAEPVSILKTGRREDVLAQNSWYGWFDAIDDTTIAVAYNYHLCWDATDTQKHIGERHNGYYMQMDTETGVWTNVKGEPLPMPLDRENANKSTLVMQTEGGDNWSAYSTLRVDKEGNPHIRYAQGPHLGHRHGGPKTPVYYRWDGEQWQVGGNDQLPVSYGDHKLHTALKADVLLASKKAKKVGAISWWHTVDGGKTFKEGDTVLEHPAAYFEVSSFIRNPHPDAMMIAAAKEAGTHLRKMYLVGENGPVMRSKAEAHHANCEFRQLYNRTKQAVAECE